MTGFGRTDPLFLYSTSTWLGHVIAQEYYGDEHYVWCCPYFDADSIPKHSIGPPPSSCPKEIYLQLADEVARGDRHSAKIDSAKAGIRRGAQVKLAAGIISSSEVKRIEEIVNLAERREFKPLLYVMSYERVKSLLQEVDPADKAHPLSPEFIIECLPRTHFEIIDFSR
jgi:hypothetical protein